MARRQKIRTNADRLPSKGGQKRLKLTTALGLILAFEAVALGIKAYDDRAKANNAVQTITHREALAISEHVTGKAGSVRQTMAVAYRAGWGPRQTASAHNDLDAVTSLADALSAPIDSRLRQAGETASRVISEGKTVALTPADDIIVIYKPDVGAARLGIVKSAAWLPQPQGARTFAITNTAQNGTQTATMTSVHACSPIGNGALSACVQTATPMFHLRDLLGLLVYGLLLAGPALAIFGLYRMLETRRGESETFEGQATRAGRVLETVLKEAKAGFWSWDVESNNIWLSQEAAELMHLNPAGFYSFDDLLAAIHPDHQSAVSQALNTMADRGYVSQTFATADKTRWLDIRARPDAEEGDLNGILLDVTEVRTALARSKQAEQRLRSALEGFSGPFALWDRRKRLVYWNRAFANVFGLEASVRVGMGYDTVALAQASSITDRRKGNDLTGAEIVRVRTGDWYKMVERQTQTGGMISMGLDVSADVQNEVQLQQQQKRLRKLISELERSEGHADQLAEKLGEEKAKAEKSANSKSAFLANMSHELRTPLNAINGFSEILSEELFGPLGHEKYKEYAGDILASGQHLLDMINDILDMAKIEAGKMTVDLHLIDLIEPVDAAVRMVRRKAEEKDIRLSIAANEGLPHVDADHRAIRQMILNLVSNAIKFTDKGGEIRVTIDQKGDEIRVAVRDNGIGIPAEALPRLAQPFEQVSDTRDRNYDGTGLGLALTKSFAEMHGGRLTIASQEGKGTQVSFFLPVPKAQPKMATSAA